MCKCELGTSTLYIHENNIDNHYTKEVDAYNQIVFPAFLVHVLIMLLPSLYITHPILLQGLLVDGPRSTSKKCDKYSTYQQ